MRKLVICVLLGNLFSINGVSPVYADILVDHPRHPYGGPSSDTDFLLAGFIPYWQSLADDFQISIPATVERVSWLGFYGGQFEGSNLPPTGNETMRIRFFGARPGDGLPGPLLFERDFLNPTRTATGLTVADTRSYLEYRFEATLSTPFEIEANTRYWIAIEQVGIPTSHFRWEYSSLEDGTGHVFSNLDYTDWNSTQATSNLAFQLLGTPEPTSVALLFLASVSINIPQRGRRKR